MIYEFIINFWERFLIPNTSKILQKTKKANEGFSLLELSIGVGVALILTLLGVMAYTNLNTNSRQSAVEQAAENAYNKAMSFELDNDSKTTPKQVEEEYNSKSDGIVVDVEELGAGRVKVVATYSDGITQATRITPVSGSSEDDNNETIPGGEQEPIIKDVITTITFTCDERLEGFLPIADLSEDTIATMNGETIPIESGMAKKTYRGEDSSQQREFGLNDIIVKNHLAPVVMEANIEYNVKIIGEFESLDSIGVHNKIREGVYAKAFNDCLQSISHIGLDTGLLRIGFIGGKKFVDVPKQIPSTVNNLAYALAASINFNDPDVKEWNVENVTNFSQMANNTKSFDQDLSNWDVSSAVRMSKMFMGSGFNNGGVSLNWDDKTQNLEIADSMFHFAEKFNQDISNWNMRNVSSATSMFVGASSFNQDLSTWRFPLIGSRPISFDINSPIANNSAFQPQWG